MSALASLAVKTAVAAKLGTQIAVVGVTAPVPFRADVNGYDGEQRTAARMGPCIETRSSVGGECIQQIDVYTTDPTGADAFRAGDAITRLLTETNAAGCSSPLPDSGGFAFTWVRADPAFDMIEDGPKGKPVTHLVLQFRIRAQSLGHAPGRF